ncbi:MAG: cell division protein FtsL [Gammaproteobacteria bacterium]|nr:cell division protein FtsL [Gammaproteobacteria bacterium]MDD9850869.1 cell division protein FtsL [Gammaproteobacteria bacterium]MDD9870885.1 cell division protein FtsL [Gammaproteobacteria bacterium]
MRSALFIAGLALALSALQLVDVRHQNLAAFMHIQQLAGEYDRLNEQWGKLLAEQATWTVRRVESRARAELGMHNPPPGAVYYLLLRPAASVAAAGAQP